jgi:hypothetical protein
LTSAVVSGAPDLADPHWFPVDLDVRGRRYAFLRLDDEVLTKSAFLDNRIDADLSDSRPVLLDDIPGGIPAGHVGWLFHTSFCCSTLLARILHFPRHQVCLKEPLVLRRLGDARYEGQEAGPLVSTTVRLLARPWDDGASVVIKPTHAALNIAADLLRETPAARAVVLTSTLEDFLVSNLKKTRETQSKIPQLADRALRAVASRLRFPEEAYSPPDLLCVAALQWAAQQELIRDIQEGAGPQRVWILEQGELLADIPRMAEQVVQWLGLRVPQADFAAHASAISQHNAKAPEIEYGAEKRQAESRMITNMFSQELGRALQWAERNLLPYMRQRDAGTAT